MLIRLSFQRNSLLFLAAVCHYIGLRASAVYPSLQQNPEQGLLIPEAHQFYAIIIQGIYFSSRTTPCHLLMPIPLCQEHKTLSTGPLHWSVVVRMLLAAISNLITVVELEPLQIILDVAFLLAGGIKLWLPLQHQRVSFPLQTKSCWTGFVTGKSVT